ncbi:MAG: molybdopterin-binding protein [bacterium]
MEWNLLEKTTFWVQGAELEAANLDEVGAAAALALDCHAGEVIVVDVQPGLVAFDVLRRNIAARAVAGKAACLLESLSRIRGVTVSRQASVHAEGILGLIALDPEEARGVVSRSEEMGQAVSLAIRKRAIVFSSGAELISGQIEDTNAPHLIRELTRARFKAEFGGVIEDSRPAAVSALESALLRGFGLIVTTGGVGAESKDHSIEAVLQLDPAAATPWILRFTPDSKRHHKEGVRIAVGRSGLGRVVALPGPHAEVRAGCRALLQGMERGLEDAALAESIASAIRACWLRHVGQERKAHGRC